MAISKIGGQAIDDTDRRVVEGEDNVPSSEGNPVVTNESNSDGPVDIQAGKGNSQLTGSQFDDVLRGSDGQDFFFGGAGDDHIIPGQGLNKIVGGAGSDTLHILDRDVNPFDSNLPFNVFADFQLFEDKLDVTQVADKLTTINVFQSSTGQTFITFQAPSPISVGDFTIEAVRINGSVTPEQVIANASEVFEGLPEDVNIVRGIDSDPLVSLVPGDAQALGLNIGKTQFFTNEDGLIRLVSGATEQGFEVQAFKTTNVRQLPPDSGIEIDTVISGDAASNPALFGDNGNDAISGRQGNDVILGNGGDDLIFGGRGDDIIDGGTGNDTIIGDQINNNSQFLAIGDGTGNDRITGGEGDDFVFGGGGIDFIFGDGRDESENDGNDELFGGSGNDFINGGGGDDKLSGDTGNDTLTGGSGADIFVFAGDSDSDVITDFKAGVDKIEFVDKPAPSFIDIFLGATPVAAIGQVSLTQDGDDVLVAFGDDDTVRLQGVDATDLDANDFLGDGDLSDTFDEAVG